MKTTKLRGSHQIPQLLTLRSSKLLRKEKWKIGFLSSYFYGTAQKGEKILTVWCHRQMLKT